MDPDPNDSFGYVENLRNQLIRALSAHGGRMTRRQWIGETCLLRKATYEQMTRKLVRKTKHHVILIQPSTTEN